MSSNNTKKSDDDNQKPALERLATQQGLEVTTLRGQSFHGSIQTDRKNRTEEEKRILAMQEKHSHHQHQSHRRSHHGHGHHSNHAFQQQQQTSSSSTTATPRSTIDANRLSTIQQKLSATTTASAKNSGTTTSSSTIPVTSTISRTFTTSYQPVQREPTMLHSEGGHLLPSVSPANSVAGINTNMSSSTNNSGNTSPNTVRTNNNKETKNNDDDDEETKLQSDTNNNNDQDAAAAGGGDLEIHGSPPNTRHNQPHQKGTTNVNRYTIVLDLDETVIYGRDGELIARAGLKQFMRSINRDKCEVIVWTAAERSYAKQVVKEINENNVIRHCIYRDKNWFDAKDYTKDLQKLGRPIDYTLIVENTIDCVRENPQNAIIVQDFEGRNNSGSNPSSPTSSNKSADNDSTLIKLAALITQLVESGKTVPKFLSQCPWLTRQTYEWDTDPPRELTTYFLSTKAVRSDAKGEAAEIFRELGGGAAAAAARRKKQQKQQQKDKATTSNEDAAATEEEGQQQDEEEDDNDEPEMKVVKTNRDKAPEAQNKGLPATATATATAGAQTTSQTKTQSTTTTTSRSQQSATTTSSSSSGATTTTRQKLITPRNRSILKTPSVSNNNTSTTGGGGSFELPSSVNSTNNTSSSTTRSFASATASSTYRSNASSSCPTPKSPRVPPNIPKSPSTRGVVGGATGASSGGGMPSSSSSLPARRQRSVNTASNSNNTNSNNNNSSQNETVNDTSQQQQPPNSAAASNGKE